MTFIFIDTPKNFVIVSIFQYNYKSYFEDKEKYIVYESLETIPIGIEPLPYHIFNHREKLHAIYRDMRRNYYWSRDFSATYYIAQAKAGFIAVTDYFEEQEVLLPEIQFAYALLDFNDLHISKKVHKLLQKEPIELIVSEEIDEVAQAIHCTHKDNWLTKKYLTMLKETQGKEKNFKVISASIRKNGILSAKRERAYNHHGTLQLVLLSHYLQQQGFAFWNLGQPYMDYKFALGAKRYERPQFLQRWFQAIDETLE